MIILRQKVFSLFKQDKFPIILKKIDNLKKSNFSFLEDYLTDLKLTRIPYSIEKSNNKIILFSGIENESVIIDLSNKTVNLPSSGLKTFLSKRSIKKLENLDSYDLFQMAFNQIYYDIAQRIYNSKTVVDLLGFKKVNELFDRFNKEFKKCGGLIR
jgi:hypothetical protein